MPETQPAIDWQAEYQKKDEMYKELVQIVAKHNCDYHSLKAKFLRMREECGAEKKRADEAERREKELKEVLERIYNITNTTHIRYRIRKAIESIYGDTV